VSARRLLMPLAAFAIVSVPISLFSQSAPSVEPQLQPGPSVASWLDELQQIQRRLDPIERQALEDPMLHAQQEVISGAIIAVMIRSDSSVVAKLDRLQAIVAEIHRIGGDPDRMQVLAEEVVRIKPSVDEAQARALSDPEIRALVDAFHAEVHKKMEQLDPEAGALIVRYQALDRMLKAALSDAQPSGPRAAPSTPARRGVIGAIA
jgi:hypothetical protein